MKPTKKLKTSKTLKIRFAHEQILLEKQRRRSRLKLEDILANSRSMKEIKWGKNLGKEIW